MSDNRTRWGVLAPGRIARKFAEAVRGAGEALDAVGSRSKERADAFADEFDIPRRYDSYAALVADPDIDAIYVSSPHPYHRNHAVLALDAGKAVLCEKPIAVNAAQARDIVAAARRNGKFAMEAMWSRFLPIVARTRALIAEGAIGAPRMVIADFGFRANVDPKGRLFDPALGGGGLLDVGCYPVSFAHMILGKPVEVKALACLGETGVDEQNVVAMKFADGALAVTASGVRTTTPLDAVVLGTDGRIRIHSPWFDGVALTLTRPGEKDRRIEEPRVENGFEYEVREVARCLREGLLESPVLPLDESVAIMETLDQARAQWGLRYPME